MQKKQQSVSFFIYGLLEAFAVAVFVFFAGTAGAGIVAAYFGGGFHRHRGLRSALTGAGGLALLFLSGEGGLGLAVLRALAELGSGGLHLNLFLGSGGFGFGSAVGRFGRGSLGLGRAGENLTAH